MFVRFYAMTPMVFVASVRDCKGCRVRRLGHVGRAGPDGRGARRRARLGPVVVRDAPRVAAALPAPCVAASAPSQVYQVSRDIL